MIRELLTYVSHRPKLKEAKTFGHLVESISLLSRESRCKKYWKPHRTQCQNFITEHLDAAIHFDSVLVLGSGPLHEIPIEILAKKFKKVTLVDIVHLKSTKSSILHLKNVEFIEHDVSELECVLMKEKKLENFVPKKFTDESWGLILSVNIMSQLPIHFNSYIEKNFKNKTTPEAVKKFLENITADHLSYLHSFKCPALLITDVRTHYSDSQDKIFQTDENYLHLKMPLAAQSWSWNIAPIPEFQKDVGMKMDVSAFVIKNHK